MYAQLKQASYQKRWEIINADTITKEKKLLYLDSYIEKAHSEKNSLEEYRALKKKSFLLPFDQAVILLHKMSPLVQNLKTDSLSGDFLNRSTTLYYKNRYFKEALDYAIQAEKFNEKVNNQYNLNVARVTIGNIYYHTQHYEKAKKYFTKAREYYKTSDNYNHIQGYISSLYSLSKCYWKLEELNALQNNIKESEQLLHKLKPQDSNVEKAYLNYLKGGNAFLNKDYNTAETYFESALHEIIKNEDVTNEHVIYLYLGKIKWEQNQKQEAIVYFSKINSLFQESKFLNYELREAYNYLRTYYKETNQTKLQLQSTESLIALNQQFEKEQRYLTDALHYQLDTSQLRAEKAALQKQLNQNKPPYRTLLMVIGGVSILSLIFLLWQIKRRRKNTRVVLPDDDLKIIDELKEDEKEDNQNTLLELTNNSFIDDYQEVETITNKLSATEQRLFDALAIFETKKKFKQTITLEELALQLGTNRTTLSNFLNTHKGGYNNYFSKLRVTEVIHDLKENKELRKKTLQELCLCYGFPNAKAFSSQFKLDVGVSPLDFIRELDELDTQNLELERLLNYSKPSSAKLK